MCARGAECRYSHDIASVINNSSKARPAAPTEPCFDFLRCDSCLIYHCLCIFNTSISDFSARYCDRQTVVQYLIDRRPAP